MDELMIRWISLVVLLIVVGIVVAYYLYTMRRVAVEHRMIYRDYARRFIAGLAGALVMFMSIQIVAMATSEVGIEYKIANVAIMVALTMFILSISLLAFVRIEIRARQNP